jgi:hypothetical protein
MTNVESLMRITWSIYWKHILTTMLVGIVWTVISGLFLGLIENLFRLSDEASILVRAATQLVVVLAASFFTLNYFLAESIGKNVRGKRLELVSDVPGETSDAH